MRNSILKLFVFVCFINTAIAQKTTSFYATMDAKDAIALQLEIPNDITIFETKNNQSAVFISEEASHILHDRVLLHGPGYVFKPTKEDAILSINKKLTKTNNKNILFTITEDVLVNQAINLVDATNIETNILNLENYGTRYHTKPEAAQAVHDLKDTWEAMAMAAGRNDISVSIFNHSNTIMPSLILTIEGAETPDDFIIVGGHIDSTNSSNNNDAPGADDNASGIATIMEIYRVLLEIDYVPKKTLELMAFAAEEVGLVGSNEIASEYSNNGINVEAYVQFDMTNYKGSSDDVYITTDSYNSSFLNNFLMELMDYYNASGSNQFSYGTTICNYGCSDHYSWAQEGYDAAFPFEAAFGQHNPNIHTSGDVFSVSGNANHAAKFVKLGLEFIIEATKSNTLAVNDFSSTNFFMFVTHKQLIYSLKNSIEPIISLNIFDSTGKKIVFKANLDSKGEISLDNLSKGFYIAVFELENQQYITKKFILQ